MIGRTDAKFECLAVRKAILDAPDVGTIDMSLPPQAQTRLDAVQKLRDEAEARLIQVFDVARAEEEERKGIVAVRPEVKEPVREALKTALEVGLDHKNHVLTKDGSSSRKYYRKCRRCELLCPSMLGRTTLPDTEPARFVFSRPQMAQADGQAA